MIFFFHSSNGNFFCCPQLRYGDWNQIAAKQCDLFVCVCVGWANSSLDAIAVECAEPTFLQFWKQISIVPHCVVINDERRACNWLHLHQPQNTFQNIIQLSYCSLICSMFFIHSIFMQQIENKIHTAREYVRLFRVDCHRLNWPIRKQRVSAAIANWAWAAFRSCPSKPTIMIVFSSRFHQLMKLLIILNLILWTHTV